MCVFILFAYGSGDFVNLAAWVCYYRLLLHDHKENLASTVF